MSYIDDKKLTLTQEELQDIVNKELQDFKKFAFQSSMVQTAVAFILGAAFKNVVTALSENIIMPFVNFVIGKTGVAWRTLAFSPWTDVTLEVGKFCGAFVDFMITAIVLFLIYKKIMGGIISDTRTKNP